MILLNPFYLTLRDAFQGYEAITGRGTISRFVRYPAASIIMAEGSIDELAILKMHIPAIVEMPLRLRHFTNLTIQFLY